MAMVNPMAWDVISQAEFAGMTFDSGVIVKNFNPATFTAPSADDILAVTTGNITHNFNLTTVNLAEDVNNIHILPKETLVVTGYENPTISFTALNCTAEMIKFMLGFATKTGTKIAPRMTTNTDTDFQNIALVLMCVGGGFVAISLSNALSTGGISLTTQKGGKDTFSVTITGYGSIEAPTVIPVEYYAVPAVAVDLSQNEVTIAVGGSVTLTATTRPANATKTWASDNTSEASVTSGGVVTGAAVGTVTITCTATDGTNTGTDTCLVHVVSAGA